MVNNPKEDNDNTTYDTSVLINDMLTVVGNSDINNSIPMSLPNDPNNLNIPVIHSLGTIEVPDILAADNDNIMFILAQAIPSYLIM